MECEDLAFCLGMGYYLGTFTGLVCGILIGRHTMRKERRQRWQGYSTKPKEVRPHVSLTSRLRMSEALLRLAEEEQSVTVTDLRGLDVPATNVGSIGYKTTMPDSHCEEDSIDNCN